MSTHSGISTQKKKNLQALMSGAQSRGLSVSMEFWGRVPARAERLLWDGCYVIRFPE